MLGSGVVHHHKITETPIDWNERPDDGTHGSQQQLTHHSTDTFNVRAQQTIENQSGAQRTIVQQLRHGELVPSAVHIRGPVHDYPAIGPYRDAHGERAIIRAKFDMDDAIGTEARIACAIGHEADHGHIVVLIIIGLPCHQEIPPSGWTSTT